MDFGAQVLSGRFLSQDEADPPRVPLELVKCNTLRNTGICGLLQLKHTVPPGEMYCRGYGYRSGINHTMRMHLKGIVQHIQEIVALDVGDVVLDIGSNDATLLKCYELKGLKKVGIDPIGDQFSEYYTDDITLVSDYFSLSNYLSVAPNRKAQVITSIAMFYDLETPMSFVADIKQILAPNGVWVFEQSYMPAMLKSNAFDTVCHEHLEYYALKQIDWMLKRSQMRILDVEFNDINGGSFRVYSCHNSSAGKANPERIEVAFRGEETLGLDSKLPYQEFKERVFRIRGELCNFLSGEKAKGKSIYIYGASTKGNVLLQFCGIDSKLITAAADRNPEKWGHYTPATHIPIISEEEARQAKPDYFLVLPWHFQHEFIERETTFLAGGGRFIFPLPELKII